MSKAARNNTKDLKAAKGSKGSAKKLAKGAGGIPRFTNRQIVMTFVDPWASVATACPFDRAHDVRYSFGGLMPAAVEKRGEVVPTSARGGSMTPRRYPGCYMVGDGEEAVSFETGMERQAQAEQELGIHKAGNVAEAFQSQLGYFAARLGGEEAFRSFLRNGEGTTQRDWVTGKIVR